MKDLEKAFGEFIDRREYDEAESALFFLVRTAFKAGWLASGGEANKASKIIDFNQQPETKPRDDK